MDKKLIKLGKKMNAQNNRSTQLPLFVVQSLKKIITNSDISDYHQFYGEEGVEMEEDELCEDCEDGLVERAESCVNCGYLVTYPIKEEWTFDLEHGVFLTGEECDEYIKRRSYAMGEGARSFGISAHRSEEMSEVLSFLSALGNKDGKAKNCYRS